MLKEALTPKKVISQNIKNLIINGFDAQDCNQLESSRVQKSTFFRPKMAIFRRTGMMEGGLPLPLAFQYLILII